MRPRREPLECGEIGFIPDAAKHWIAGAPLYDNHDSETINNLVTPRA
jgi:hypothetical protein